MNFFGFKGSGDCLIDIFDDAGMPTGLQLKGNCKNITIKGAGEIEEMIGFGRDNYGMVIESDTSPKPHTVSFVFTQLDAELFAAGFSGLSTTLTQTVGTLADQAITLLSDRWVECGKLMISEAVVKDPTGATTYTLGTDYEVNARLGMIKALSTGTIVGGTTCKLSCAHAAVNGVKITGATRANVLARVVVDGKERSKGRNFIFNGKKIRLAASNEIALISDKFVEASFDGTFQTPTGETSPYDLTFLS